MTRAMTLRTTAALLFTLALTTGCFMTHGDPKKPQKNSHPVKRYEVIVTAEAPGPWDAVSGRAFFDVANVECTPENKFLGVHKIPKDVVINIEMTRVDEKTWNGYFYRDSIQDEDYYGLGVCHWDASAVAADFVVHGETFTSSDTLEDLLQKGHQTEYFKKSEYLNQALTGDQAWVTTETDPEVAQHPDAFFPIAVAIKEATP